MADCDKITSAVRTDFRFFAEGVHILFACRNPCEDFIVRSFWFTRLLCFPDRNEFCLNLLHLTNFITRFIKQIHLPRQHRSALTGSTKLFLLHVCKLCFEISNGLQQLRLAGFFFMNRSFQRFQHGILTVNHFGKSVNGILQFYELDIGCSLIHAKSPLFVLHILYHKETVKSSICNDLRYFHQMIFTGVLWPLAARFQGRS